MAAKKGNMFAALALDDDESQPTIQAKKQQPEKKQDPKQKKAQEEPRKPKPVDPQPSSEGFEQVNNQERARVQRGGPRGGRGGDRGFRGGRGGRGGRGSDRPQQFTGEEGGAEGQESRGRGGYRGSRRGRGEGFGRGEGRGEGRGRGDGPRYRPKTAGDDAQQDEGDQGLIIANRKEKIDYNEKHVHRFQGKRREEYHPYDRRDGTGRGRGLAKGGHGRGNLGDMNDEIKGQEEAAQITPATEEEKKAEGQVEVEEPVTQEEKVEEPVREEEKDEYADAITLDDYFAKKKKPVAKKEVRKVEEVKKANLEKVDAKKEKVATIESNLRGMETYTAATAKTEYDNLLGFQGQEDDFGGERRGGRGGRGRDRGGRGRGGFTQGGRRGNQGFEVSESAFPSL